MSSRELVNNDLSARLRNLEPFQETIATIEESLKEIEERLGVSTKVGGPQLWKIDTSR